MYASFAFHVQYYILYNQESILLVKIKDNYKEPNIDLVIYKINACIIRISY
jgi:hypothetical protein